MDRRDLDDLCGGIGDFLTIAIFLAFDGGAFGGWVFGNRTDGGDQYDSAESRAGSVARTDYGGLRDDVYGGPADRFAPCGGRGETDRCALYIGGIRDVVFLGEHGFYFSRSHAIRAAAGGAGHRLGRIGAVQPGGF